MRHSHLIGAVTIAGLGFVATRPVAATEVPTYTATYEVLYKGRRAGTSEFSVAEDGASGHLMYTSSTRARGILRLARPNPAVDRSVFELVDGHVRPLEFWYEDGSRKGEDNAHVTFDWSAGEARIRSESGDVSVPLEAGMLDRGAVQVAIMLAAAEGRDLGPYKLIDDDGVKTYSYEPRPPADADTGIGPIPTKVFLQQREGSSRSTLLWLAPSLRFLPVRMEQIRNGEVETVFVLDDVEGLQSN